MARILARNAKLLGAGYDLSGRSNSISLSLTAEAPEVTSFGVDTRERLSGGVRDTELSADGFFDTSASQTDELFSTFIGASQFWGVFPEGFGASKLGREFPGIMTGYESESATEDATTTSVTVVGSAFSAHVLSLGNVTTSSAASGSAATTSVNFAGSATSTWGFLHFLDISGSVVAASLQHSGDDVTFTTLIDFGQFDTASFGYAIATSANGANGASQYRRARYYVGAGASVSFVMSSGS